jgi:uncharacterized protein YhhL (DUF1145 family)
VTSANGPLFPVQWEELFNAHPEVYRTALVGVGPAGRQEPVVCVELREPAGAPARRRIEAELRMMATAHELTRDARRFLFHPRFPVDIRHNAKIGREELARWAAEQLHGASDRRRRWLRLVPILGWLFILLGIVFPFSQRLLQALWWIDVALSVGLHGLQLFAALPAGKKAGYSTAKSVIYTFLFGATWWKFLRPRVEP